MSNVTVIGVDISKRAFHIAGLSSQGKLILRKQLKRNQVLAWFANHPPCQVSLEACASSHYWGRELEALGHQVSLLPAQHVKAYLQGNKNDYNDAIAIAEATNRPRIHTVPLKTVNQQDQQAIQRMRKQAVSDRTALCNQTRGLLGEYGIVLPQGVSTLKKTLPTILEDGDNGLTPLFRQLLRQRYEQLMELDEHITFYTEQLVEQAKLSHPVQQLQTIPGFGPVVASAYYSHVGDGRAFSCGRDVSASLGLVPRQHSTGGKTVLLNISKRGDQELRGLLVHGARSVIRMAHKKQDRLSRWACRLVERRGINKATVALANKLARIAWAVTTQNKPYSIDKVVA